MIKISHALVLVMAIWCAGLLVWTSQSVQKTEKELASVQYRKNIEMESARVLMSEWEYLNRPSRLESLIADYQFEDNKQTVGSKILVSAQEIKEPIIPALPKIKPVRYFRQVGFQDSTEIQPWVRVKRENNFDGVISGLLKDAGAADE